jgi:flagellar export protein FliJ
MVARKKLRRTEKNRSMKRQKFSLQTILDLREKAKDKAEEVFAAAIRERDLAANRVAQAAARLDELTRMISGERFPAYLRAQSWDALTAQRDLLRTLQQRLAQEEKKVAEKRELLVVADRDHRLVCKLKEKWALGVAVEQARSEEKILEDFVTTTRFLQPAH